MTNFFTILLISVLLQGQIFIPIGPEGRKDISKIHLTKIGQFGLIRKARPAVAAHYHTGIDIKRSGTNYESEPVFPIAKGIVISKRTDGPYANLIIEHEINGVKLWSLYEHISGIKINVAEAVDPGTPIARFMNKAELDRFGWQFDHFHFELIKIKPIKTKPTAKNPERFFNSYSLVCYRINDLKKYYFDPMEYFNYNINK